MVLQKLLIWNDYVIVSKLDRFYCKTRGVLLGILYAKSGCFLSENMIKLYGSRLRVI